MVMFLQSVRKTRRSSNGRQNPVVISCPFCGANADLPHESQEACIAALQEEIARTREIVERVRPHADAAPADDQAAGPNPARRR
jgi:hypothetical protein